MARMLKLAVVILCLFTAGELRATTYYVDYAGGSDNNDGQSKGTAWQHAPGMNSCAANCASVNLVNGDRIILKGGVTWPNSSFRWTLGSNRQTIYIGVDQTWFAGSSWTRPILDAGGVGIMNNMSQMFWLGTGVTFDNFEIKGFYWDNTVCAGHPPGGCTIFNDSQNDGWEVKNIYVHGWTHAGTNGATSNGTSFIFLGNGGPNTSVHDSVFDGSDVPGDHSINVFFSGPPIAYNNYIKQVSSGFIVSPGGTGQAIYHDNHIEDIGPTYCNLPFSQYAGSCAHENAFEDNADNGLLFYNNEITGVNAGLALWIAPNPNHTAYLWNNVITQVHDNQVTDLAHPVYQSSFCSSGQNAQGYCNNAGNFILVNNTIECGDDKTQYDLCQNQVGFAGGQSFFYQSNHFISASNASGCKSGLNGCTFDSSNTVQTLSVANKQGYSSHETYAFSSKAGGNATIGAGINQGVLCTAITLIDAAAGAACLKDTTYGVSYSTSDHTVSYPARSAQPRGLSWDSGAYQYSSSTSTTVQPPTSLVTTVN